MKIRIGEGDGRIALSKPFIWGAFVLIGVLISYLLAIQSYLLLALLIYLIFLPFFALYINPIFLIYMLIISVPFSKYELFSLNRIVEGAGEVPVNSSHILGIMLITTSAIRFMPKMRDIKIGHIGKTILLILLAYLVSIVSVYQAYHNYTEYFKSLINIVFFALLYFAFTNSVGIRDNVIKILKVWVIVSLIVASYGIYQFIHFFVPYLPIIYGTEITEYGGLPRLRSFLTEAVELAKYLTYPTAFIFLLIVEGERIPFKSKMKNFFALLVMLSALIMSFSMTAYLCLSIFMVLFAFSQINPISGLMRKLRLPLLITGIIIIFGICTETGKILMDRLFLVVSLADPSARWRLHTLSVGWQEFLEYPIFGIGAGNFPSYTATGIFPEAIYGYEIFHADTLVFQILAELGIFGFMAIGIFFVVIIGSLKETITMNKANILNSQISRGLLLIIMTYIGSTLFLSGWLEFWIWNIFSIAGSWVLIENQKGKRDSASNWR
jgi:O-antigen ligase